MAIEGFGSVGNHTALGEVGTRLVAGAVYDPQGTNVDRLTVVKMESGTVTAYPKGCKMPAMDLLTLPCDILVPAVRPDCIHAGNAEAIQAKLILQGANIPATADAEAVLHRHEFLVVPDFIANAGGVICASVEYHGGSEAMAFEQIAQKIKQNTAVLSLSRGKAIAPRLAAVELARERVRAAVAFRRRS